MLKSPDGKVFYREWNCVSPRAVIILVHGMGGYSGRFFEMGPYLAKAGFQIFAIELKGHGESPSIKGHVSNFKLYTVDLKALIGFARSQNPGKKIFIFGESMGGLITLDFVIHYQRMVNGIILMSPGLSDLFIPLKTKLAVFLNLPFRPMKYFDANFRSDIFTRDKVVAKRIENDPLEQRKFTAKFFFAIFKSVIYVSMMPWKIMLPVLMILAGQDKMVSAQINRKYFKKLRSRDKDLRYYPEMYHALYVDKDREKVFKDIIDWIEKRL